MTTSPASSNNAVRERGPDTCALAFVKELATYYMDFLETDFHRRRNPKRMIHFRNKDNLLVGVSLARYPSFATQIWKAVARAFRNGALDHVSKGSYRTTVPQSLLRLVDLEAEKVSPSQIVRLCAAIGAETGRLVRSNRSDFDAALNASLEFAAVKLASELVVPIISRLRAPLENAGLADENTLYLMEQELRDLLFEPARSKISEIVRRLVTGHAADPSSELETVLDVPAVKSQVLTFFSDLAIGDLFVELYELQRNKSILEKQEFYLYFGDIRYENIKYPLFYIPFQATVDGDRIAIDFDSRVYVNKRALEYIGQQENERTGKKGSLRCTKDRIIYLAQHEDDFARLLSSHLSELSNFFTLDNSIDIANPASQLAKGVSICLTNSCYIALFDNSDEALLNDYEQLLQLLAAGPDAPLAAAFTQLVDDFIHREPESVASEVEGEWDGLSVPDRLVFESPIPLNSEQRQILLALQKDRAKYITVEGPPGTGKSHTITAIVCQSVLQRRSVLVLSDKKEALDVVEDKIISTLNRVRADRQFQNPILRLGSTGSTYAQILSAAVMEGIKTHFRAVKKEHQAVEQAINQTVETLREDLEAEVLTYSDIEFEEIAEWARLETHYTMAGPLVDADEMASYEGAAADLEDIRKLALLLREIGSRREPFASLATQLGFSFAGGSSELSAFLARAAAAEGVLKKVTTIYPDAERRLALVSSFSGDDPSLLTGLFQQYRSLKMPVFGYLFTKGKVETLDQHLRQRFGFASPEAPHARLTELAELLAIANFSAAEGTRIAGPCDWVAVCHRGLTVPGWRAALQQVAELADAAQNLGAWEKKYARTLAKLRLDLSDCPRLAASGLAELPEQDFTQLVRYLVLGEELRKKFRCIPEVDYGEAQRRIEDLVTVHMTYVLDGQVIDFYENQRNTAKALRDVIRAKQQFPKEEFGKLRQAFPCILAGIRDYAEYIPLEPEMFDLLIIDEASQVSIAQALPALLRARKILILGDKRQFSNIKAVQARSDTNREYLNRLEASFRRHVSQEPTKLVKLERFNIRTSVLEFFEFVSNYHTQLLKHFRGYKEIISYSNALFYRNTLQVMKIRGKPIDDVIRFTILTGSAACDRSRNANEKEAEAILAELRRLKEAQGNVSVGIITPHTDQQKLLVDMVGKALEREYFYGTLKLKIMTFDTCQGEERDIVFYSMVASHQMDRLWGVFIKDLASVDLEEDGKIKAQRLNVGFSRAKECMHFFLSKELDGFEGAVGEALRHFWAVREEARKERSITEVDERSVRERDVLNWFYQTEFWRTEKQHTELVPQFEIGKYLRQLDPLYEHPLYRVDFLLLHRPGGGREHKIIIEYDGFKEHFRQGAVFDADNYEVYYSEEDIFRQKVLESYGYGFLRINRFNVGQNPIATLDERLRQATAAKSVRSPHRILQTIHENIEHLKDGELKECPKCRQLRPSGDFLDSLLASGTGRFCQHCKAGRTPRRAVAKTVPAVSPAGRAISCPKCGSKMILRSGRYGRFYGCSRFPYCRATRPVMAG